MAAEGFDSREEAVRAFEGVRRRAAELEEEAFGAEALQLLRRVERAVQSLALFSPNEPFEELDVDLQPLVLLPYFLALAEGARRTDRPAALDGAAQRLHAFLGLAQHYELLSPLGRRVRAQLQAQPELPLAREEKIALYREERALQDEAGALAAAGAAAKLNANAVALCALKALGRLLLLPQERQIAAFAQKLQSDPRAREEYERQRAEPPPPLSFFRVEQPPAAHDCPAAPPAAQVVESFAQRRENERVGKLESLRAHNPNNARLALLAKLNQPSHPQPTMTLDEFDELEYSLMKQKEAEGARFRRQKDEFNARMKIDDSDDSDNELVGDAKTRKARAWDDFKDENEKGAGNRHGK